MQNGRQIPLNFSAILQWVNAPFNTNSCDKSLQYINIKIYVT